MKTHLSLLSFFSLGAISALSLRAQNTTTTPAATATPAAADVAAPAAQTRSPRPPPDTHGLDMRTQSGPAETMSTRGYSPPIPVDPSLPTVWLIGDSTVRNGSPGNGATGGQWGWGAPLTFYFDAKKINVVNRALGGTSSHSYYDANWKTLLPLIKKGDFVIMQFGANDNGAASLRGVGDETQESAGRGGQTQTLHTFGWYMKQFVQETRDKGAIPIICSLTPRARFKADGSGFNRDVATHVAWAAEVAKETNTPYIDLYERIARKSEELGPEKTTTLYPAGEVLHTNWDGAVVNAECVVSGLKALKEDPLAKYYSDKGQAIVVVDLTKPAIAASTPAAPATPTSAGAK